MRGKSSRSLINAVESRDVCSLVFISSSNKFGAFQNRLQSNLKYTVAQHLVTQPQASGASHEADYLCNSPKQCCILPEGAWRGRMWLAGTSLRFPLGFSLFLRNIHEEEGAPTVGKHVIKRVCWTRCWKSSTSGPFLVLSLLSNQM